MNYTAILLAILFMFVLVHVSLAREYVVDVQHQQASDENTGTAERPFKTISHAAQIVRSSDTVIVKAGVYRESGDFPNKFRRPFAISPEDYCFSESLSSSGIARSFQQNKSINESLRR